MRMLSTVLAICVSVAACAAVVSPTLPEPDWPDSEAATNAQLAFGRDADGDGELSYAETALVMGRGLGEAFVEDVAARIRYAEALPPAVGRRGLGWRVFLRADGTPTGLTATNEAGVAVFPEWRHAPPAWSFDPSWDMVRAVSAGSDDADGRVRVEIGPDGTLCVFR